MNARNGQCRLKVAVSARFTAGLLVCLFGMVNALGVSEAGRLGLMFSWLTDISRDGVDPEAIWAVIANGRAGQVGQSWAALVSAVTCPITGGFAFESDARLGVGDSLVVRYRDQKLDRMVRNPRP